MRQNRFKARLREAGKNQITVWADNEQATAIREMLAGNAQPPQVALAKRSDTEKMSFGDRRKKLIEIHTTTSDWKTGERKTIDTAWSAADSKKQMADLSRKTRVAANTLKSVTDQFGKHELLSAREKAALELARIVMGELADAASDAKDAVATHARATKEAEEARQRAAHIAAKNAFGEKMSPEDCIAVVAYTSSYELGYMLDNLHDYNIGTVVSDMQRKAFDEIKYKIDRTMSAGLTAKYAIAKIRGEFDAQRSDAIAKYAVMIRDINTMIVQSRLEEANSKGK